MVLCADRYREDQARQTKRYICINVVFLSSCTILKNIFKQYFNKFADNTKYLFSLFLVKRAA